MHITIPCKNPAIATKATRLGYDIMIYIFDNYHQGAIVPTGELYNTIPEMCTLSRRYQYDVTQTVIRQLIHDHTPEQPLMIRHGRGYAVA